MTWRSLCTRERTEESNPGNGTVVLFAPCKSRGAGLSALLLVITRKFTAERVQRWTEGRRNAQQRIPTHLIAKDKYITHFTFSKVHC